MLNAIWNPRNRLSFADCSRHKKFIGVSVCACTRRRYVLSLEDAWECFRWKDQAFEQKNSVPPALPPNKNHNSFECCLHVLQRKIRKKKKNPTKNPEPFTGHSLCLKCSTNLIHHISSFQQPYEVGPSLSI